MSWKESIPDLKDKVAVQKYFDDVFAKYQSLREFVNNYTFAIPIANFSSYQTKLQQFQDNFGKHKDQAIPKKKFSFVKKSANTVKNDKKAFKEGEIDQKYR